LKQAGRVEFTVMTPAGQDKGHAIVAEDLRDDEGNPVDFLLPRDTKREVRLENAPTSVGGQTFVGLSFVHGRNQMRLDIQSLINLHPFFDEEQLSAGCAMRGSCSCARLKTARPARRWRASTARGASRA
jgi:hypothetical protein